MQPFISVRVLSSVELLSILCHGQLPSEGINLSLCARQVKPDGVHLFLGMFRRCRRIVHNGPKSGHFLT